MNQTDKKKETSNRGSRRFPLFLGPLIALLLTIALFTVLDLSFSQGQFFTFENLSDVSIQTCVYAIAAVGMTIIIISGGIDLSCGTALTLSATVAGWCIFHDVGSLLSQGTNVRNTAVRVAAIDKVRGEVQRKIAQGADGQSVDKMQKQQEELKENLEQAKKDLKTLIRGKIDLMESRRKLAQSILDKNGWSNLSEEEEDDLKKKSYWQHDRYDRASDNLKRLTENIRVQEERITALDSEEFWVSVETAKKDWGRNLPNHPFTIHFAILAGVFTGVFCGFVNGFLIAFLKIVPFVVTLGTMTIFLGIGNLISGKAPIRTIRDDMLPSWYYQTLSLNSEYLFLGLPPGIWILLVAAIVFSVFLGSTVLGRYSFAVGSNESTARLCGIDVTRQKLLIYSLSGALVGLAGVFQLSRLNVADPGAGLGLELKIIAAVIIGGGSLTGGRGSIAGTLCGAAMLAVILNGCSQVGLPVTIEKVVVGVIIIVAVYLDQPGVKKAIGRLFQRE